MISPWWRHTVSIGIPTQERQHVAKRDRGAGQQVFVADHVDFERGVIDP